MDITMVSPLHADGTPIRAAAATDGVAIAAAENRKAARYPELTSTAGAKLVVLACETGGRWSETSVSFVQALASAKARAAPDPLRRSAAVGWQQRWSSMLAVAAQAALAATLLGADPWSVAGRDGYVPGLDSILEEDGPAVSRLPGREDDDERR